MPENILLLKAIDDNLVNGQQKKPQNPNHQIFEKYNI